MRYCGDDHEPGNESMPTKKEVVGIIVTLILGVIVLVSIGYGWWTSFQ